MCRVSNGGGGGIGGMHGSLRGTIHTGILTLISRVIDGVCEHEEYDHPTV